MKELTIIRIAEMKLQKAQEQEGKCAVCKKPLLMDLFPQLAHRIGQGYISVYGEKIIHHPLNLALVCSLECNGKVNLHNRPEEKKALLEEILSDLGGEYDPD